MTVELRPAAAFDRLIINNLWTYYLYDMSEYTSWPVSPNGTYAGGESNLDDYWQQTDHRPYLILCDGEIAGFSLLRKFPGDPSLNDIGQFFILRKFKGRGVGRRAFRLSISEYPGKWLTRVLEGNEGALRFWTTVIAEAAADGYSVTMENYGPHRMHFIRYEIAPDDLS